MSSSLNTIIQQIAQSNPRFSFSQFMQLCLYHPEFGYYSTKANVLGKHGDFITAPEVSPLFGVCVANQCADVFQSGYDILEFGAGTGKLARDILLQLDNLGALPDHYYIIEISVNLKHQQKQTLQAYPHLLARCQWLTEWPGTPIKGIVIANEVLDAMPVELFRIGSDNKIQQGFVCCRNNGFQCHWQEPNDDVKQTVSQLGPLLENYQSEINLNIKPWLAGIYDCLSSGAVLLIDYGMERSSYYLPDRHSGTLMCHHQHKTHTDPFIHVGEQDLTAHVDFTAVAESAYDLGFNIAGYTTQAAFLIATGITSLLSQLNEKEQISASQAIKKLTLPHEMGEVFKCIALTKSYSKPLLGFSFQDYLHKL